MSEKSNDKYQPPEPTIEDFIHSTTKTIVSIILILSVTASELFKYLITSQLERRRIQWIGM